MSLVYRLLARAAAPLLAVLLAAAPAAAADPTPQAIDAVVRRQLPPGAQYALGVAIIHLGRPSYLRAYGSRDLGTPDTFVDGDKNYYGLPVARAKASHAPADIDTIYAIGSVTKQFTAAAILLLAERRQLALDDPIERYAPEFRGSGLTVRMLLWQRSGLPDHNALPFLERVKPLARRPDGSFDELRISREIAAGPRAFAADARFAYSNANSFVLGTIVERVAHRPLGAFLHEAFFAPLGMTRTAYATRASNDDVAVGYRLDAKGVLRRAYPWDLAWLGGAGAMTSTVADLARWDTALLTHRVLQPSSLAEYWHGRPTAPGQGAYAMGWIEDAIGAHRYLWHNGEVGGFRALNVVFPSDDLAFAILTNDQDARPEFLLPALSSLYFPVQGLDRVLPRSGVALLEASLAVGLGALAIAVVALLTLRRFAIAGIAAPLLAFVLGFFLPSIVGFVWAGVAALLPTALYVLAVLAIPKRSNPTVGKHVRRR